MSFVIRKASKAVKKLRLGLAGPSGAGKTWSALLLAKSLGCKKICLLDTEKGSSDLYSQHYDFDKIDFEAPYSPARFVEAINMVGAAGYDCLIIDSASHEWIGEGGCLQMVNRIPGNSYVAWGKVGAEHDKFIEAILAAPCHVISTLRAKTAYILEENSQGKMAPRKKGMEAQTREGTEFEYDLVFDIDIAHNFIASKDRTNLFKGDIPQPLDESVGKKLLAWLNSGEKASSPPELPPETVIVPTVQDRANALSAALDAITTLEDVKAVEQGFNELKADLTPKALEFLQLKLNTARSKVENF